VGGSGREEAAGSARSPAGGSRVGVGSGLGAARRHTVPLCPSLPYSLGICLRKEARGSPLTPHPHTRLMVSSWLYWEGSGGSPTAREGCPARHLKFWGKQPPLPASWTRWVGGPGAPSLPAGSCSRGSGSPPPPGLPRESPPERLQPPRVQPPRASPRPAPGHHPGGLSGGDCCEAAVAAGAGPRSRRHAC